MLYPFSFLFLVPFVKSRDESFGSIWLLDSGGVPESLSMYLGQSLMDGPLDTVSGDATANSCFNL